MKNNKEVEIKKYGRLQVVKEIEPLVLNGKGRIRTRRRVLCMCDCGKEYEVRLENLMSGKTNSCGCYKADITSERFSTHKMTESRIYRIWSGIVTRTTNNNRGRTSLRYVGRGIKNEFKSFEHFYETMYPTYKDGLTIDRKNNDGNYSPDNCRWATHSEQVRNTSRTRYITYQGYRVKMRELCEAFKISYNTVRSRIDQMKWDVNRAFEYKKIPQHLIDERVS